LAQKAYDVNKIPCQVFAGRSNYTLQSPDNGYCMGLYYPNLEDAKEALQKAYEERAHKCLKDAGCPVFEYCAYSCCPKNGLDRSNNFFDFDNLECVLNKIVYESAIKLLSITNDCCADAQLYQRYLNQFDYPGKEDIINGDLLSMSKISSI
jgi:hypothetical protein